MTTEELFLQPGTLRARVREVTARALQSGALHTLPTRNEFVEQDGIVFLVRVAANLARKEAGSKTPPPADFNPFLPPEPALWVADLSATHCCVLNKYNVVDHHILIVTRAFEEQESPLNEADFAALWTCLAEIDGLGFYNAGPLAGASQRHKHLQVVPLPLTSRDPPVPIEPALAAARFDGVLGVAPGLPFAHVVARVDPAWLRSPAIAAEQTAIHYQAMLKAVGLHPEQTARPRPGPYNLLVTRRWLWLVPRARERFDSIALNALGFAGALLAKNDQQRDLLVERGPLTALASVVAPLPA